MTAPTLPLAYLVYAAVRHIPKLPSPDIFLADGWRLDVSQTLSTAKGSTPPPPSPPPSAHPRDIESIYTAMPRIQMQTYQVLPKKRSLLMTCRRVDTSKNETQRVRLARYLVHGSSVLLSLQTLRTYSYDGEQSQKFTHTHYTFGETTTGQCETQDTLHRTRASVADVVEQGLVPTFLAQSTRKRDTVLLVHGNGSRPPTPPRKALREETPAEKHTA